METQLDNLRAASESLSSISSNDSAATALERTRNLLFDVDVEAIGSTSSSSTNADNNASELSRGLELTHDLMNEMEALLRKCATSIEDGVTEKLLEERQSVPVTLEDLDWHIAEWNALGRKHGLTNPALLPQLQHSLRNELEGTHEAREKLPRALEEEVEARVLYEHARVALRKARTNVATRLSRGVTHKWLPQLGMEGSSFHIDVIGGGE
jgi:DNA repair ATPase RecN